MLGLENEFSRKRGELINQYVDAWRCDSAFLRHNARAEEIKKLAEQLEGEPHPVIKAKCFAHLLKTAPIYVNPDDWFGISLEVAKMEPLSDVGVGYWRPLLELNKKWIAEIDEKLNPKKDEHFSKYARGHLLNEFSIDYSHSTPCWEDILSLGIVGLIERARKYRRKAEPLSAEQTAYFDGIDISLHAMVGLLERYAKALESRREPRLVIMRAAITSLISAPPKNTYEALLLAWIWWYAQEQVDALRVRTMGAIDRLYLGFYKRDTESGLFTRDDIKEMLTYFMCGFHALRVFYQQPMYLGGVDDDGNCIVNELSYIALEAYKTLSAPNPKLQIIISENTPDEFLRRVLDTIREGNSSISIINHENAEKSLLKFGVTKEEARTYLMSGCWDFAVRNHEVKTVPIRVSLPKILEYTLTGGICLSTGESVGKDTGNDFKCFEDFFASYEAQWLYIQDRSMGIIENWELYLAEISPSNLYSATMTDSLERAADGYARGMKYNNTVYCVCGLATLVDSLIAIKKYVFERKEITLSELTQALRRNWQGYESLRRRILADRDKYGNGRELADELTVRLISFFVAKTNKKPNSRGGEWKLGVLSIDKNLRFGELMCATPDGRLAGEPISKNLSPVIGMDRGGITVLLNSVAKIDFTDLPHSGMLDLILHPTAVEGEEGLTSFAALVRAYFKKGGHSLQFNVFSSELLKAAQREPQKYRNLQIRVCGWNVYFVELEKTMQNEFIKECEHREGIL